MENCVESHSRARFGEFEVDLRTGELRDRERESVRLPEQQFRILVALLERTGEVVTRDEMRKLLWPNDTAVEFEHGINAAINRLRQALNDSASQPKYLETLPRRGYRWKLPVEWVKTGPEALPQPELPYWQRFSPGLAGKKISHYRVLEVLGRGGMGVVYLAEDIKLGRRVAMKVLPEELANDAKALERFEREARTASALEHPNICPVYEFGEYEGHLFIVMQLLEGETLRERIEARCCFERQEWLDVSIQITRGLEAAHRRGVVHRDIKPANIFLTQRHEAKILDFGISTIPRFAQTPAPGVCDGGSSATTSQPASSPSRLPRAGTTMGTSAYMSPEQICGDDLDARTDLFSFGLVLYEMATGRKAFPGGSAELVEQAILNQPPVRPRDVNPQIAPTVVDIIDKCLQKDRSLRYQQASEILTDLERLTGGMSSRGTRWIVAAAGAAGCLALASILYGLLTRPAPTMRSVKQQQLTLSSSENPVRGGAISPDGKYLVYSEVQHLYLKMIQTGETYAVPYPPDLIGKQAAWDIVWFPDGSRFLGVAAVPGQRPGIWAFQLLGGSPRKLRDGAYTWTVSPDGATIVFTTNPGSLGDREIWEMGANGEQARKLFAAGEENAFESVKWFPDSNRLAYFRLRRSGKVDKILETRDLGGGPPTEVSYDPRIREFHCLPKGRLIYVLEEPGSSGGLSCNFWEMRIDLRTGQVKGSPKQLTDWAGFCMTALSAEVNGRRLSFLRFDAPRVVYVADFEAKALQLSAPKRLTKGESREIPAAWTADSSSVLFADFRDGGWKVFRQRLGDDLAQPVISSIEDAGGPAAGHFDSTTIAGEKALEDLLCPRLSPDGNWLLRFAFPRGPLLSSMRLMRVPLRGGPPNEILSGRFYDTPRCTKSPARLCAVAEEASDHRQLIFKGFDPADGTTRELVRFDIDPTVRYDADFTNGIRVPYSWDLAPDGCCLAILKRLQHEIHILSLRDKSERRINVKGWTRLSTLNWAMDSKGLFASALEPSVALLYVNPRGNAHVLWQPSGSIPTEAIQSPDGRHLAILVLSRNNNIWTIEDF